MAAVVAAPTATHVTTASGSTCHRPGPRAGHTRCGRHITGSHHPGHRCTQCAVCHRTVECPTCGGEFARLLPHRERVMTRDGVVSGPRWCDGAERSSTVDGV